MGLEFLQVIVKNNLLKEIFIVLSSMQGVKNRIGSNHFLISGIHLKKLLEILNRGRVIPFFGIGLSY